MHSDELAALWREVSALLTEEHFSGHARGYVAVPDAHYAAVQRLFDTRIADAVLQEMRERPKQGTPQGPAPEGAAPTHLGAPGKELRNCS